MANSASLAETVTNLTTNTAVMREETIMDGVRVSTMQRAESVRTVLLKTRTSTTAETVNSVRIVRASTTTLADRVKEVIVSSVRTVLHTATSRKEEKQLLTMLLVMKEV